MTCVSHPSCPARPARWPDHGERRSPRPRMLAPPPAAAVRRGLRERCKRRNVSQSQGAGRSFPPPDDGAQPFHAGVHKPAKAGIRTPRRPFQGDSKLQVAAWIPRAAHSLRDVAACSLNARRGDAGWSSPVARQAHNLKVIGSNPIPATTGVAIATPSC